MRPAKLEDGQTIEQEVIFESEDAAFSGIIRMIWTFQSGGNRTLVTVRAENVPEGIRPEDHQAGLTSSLENRARFAEDEKVNGAGNPSRVMREVEWRTG